MKFKGKVFVSLLLTLSFFLAAASGIALYLSPRGRIANWTEWTLLGLTRTEWTDLHLIGMAVMLITGLLHLFWFNWKVLLSYLGKRVSGTLRHPVELALSVALFVVLFVGVRAEVPGLYGFTTLRNTILDSYEKVEYQPPIPHAEELALTAFSQQVLNRPFSEMKTALESNGWSVEEGNETMAAFAARHEVSPNDVFKLLEPLQPVGKVEANGDPAASTSSFQHGGGYGMMTLDQFCAKEGITVGAASWALGLLGVEQPRAGATLLDLSQGTGYRPGELAEAVLQKIRS